MGLLKTTCFFKTIIYEKIMSIPDASKYLIIGAGIHGLSTAYHLALDRGESIMKKSRYSLALHPESW